MTMTRMVTTQVTNGSHLQTSKDRSALIGTTMDHLGTNGGFESGGALMTTMTELPYVLAAMSCFVLLLTDRYVVRAG